MASASFRVRVKPNKNPVRAVVCLNGKPWGAVPGGAGQGGGAAARPSPRASPKAAAAAAAAAVAEEAEAGESGAIRVCSAGSVISGLHMKLYDQGGAEVVVGKKTFEVGGWWLLLLFFFALAAAWFFCLARGTQSRAGGRMPLWGM